MDQDAYDKIAARAPERAPGRTFDEIVAAAEPVQRTRWTADEVLDAQTGLTERFAHPDMNLLDYVDYYITDAVEKNGQRAAGMFYPVDTRGTGKPTMQGLRRYLGIHARALSEATTYQVTTDMIDVMKAVHDKTQRVVGHLDEREIPVESGWAWLDKPWVITDVSGKPIPTRVISWHLDHALTNGTDYDPLDGAREIPCARITLWTHHEDDIAYGTFDGSQWADQAQHVRDRLGPLTIVHTALVPFGLRFRLPDEENDKRTAESIVSVVHILWMFLGMELTQTKEAQVSRPSRRRAQRSLKSSKVNVVVLRRIRHPETGESVTHQHIDWTCRWVVQGHYRHLDSYEGSRHHAVPAPRGQLCEVCGSRLAYVRPYIKGPDGAPLKVAGPTLYKLAR